MIGCILLCTACVCAVIALCSYMVVRALDGIRETINYHLFEYDRELRR